LKKVSLVLVAVLLFIFSMNVFSFATEEVTTNKVIVNEVVVQKDTALQNVVKILDKITLVALPVCVFFVAWGTVQYFILGIRNLYKKKQGLLLMFSSLTFYVILLIFSFTLTLISTGEFNQSIDVSQVVDNVEETTDEALNGIIKVVVNTLRYIAEWSLPFCAILVVFGATQYYIMGIRNLYKKRQGLLLMFGSIAFFLIIVVLNFAMQVIFSGTMIK